MGNKMLSELEKVVAHNRKQVSLVEGDAGRATNVITFVFEGMSIYDPFYDSTLRFSVDPFEEYGMDNIKKMIEDYNTFQKQ